MTIVELAERIAEADGRIVGPYLEREQAPEVAAIGTTPVRRRLYVVVLGQRHQFGPPAEAAYRDVSGTPVAYLDVDQAGEVTGWTPTSPVATLAAILFENLGKGAAS